MSTAHSPRPPPPALTNLAGTLPLSWTVCTLWTPKLTTHPARPLPHPSTSTLVTATTPSPPTPVRTCSSSPLLKPAPTIYGLVCSLLTPTPTPTGYKSIAVPVSWSGMGEYHSDPGLGSITKTAALATASPSILAKVPTP